MSRSADLSGLTDAEGGPLDRAMFTYAELHRQEWGRMFARIRACLDSCPHFGTRNPEPLREPLGDVARYRDVMFGHDDQGTVVVGRVHE
ncbi:hypothetical protein ACFV6Z_36505 [Streptomyces sp. NPDC059818]|uniref:hypothetical protein n=1 Tax=Streptomyces sp. NPDC059818 TaxID=3346962 RepID=UPI003656C07B